MDGDHEYKHEVCSFEVGTHVQVSTSLKEVRKRNDEVVVLGQLRDKLADLIQLLCTGILPHRNSNHSLILSLLPNGLLPLCKNQTNLKVLTLVNLYLTRRTIESPSQHQEMIMR